MESKFTGGLLGLIGIQILSTLISVVTLGFGVPWAVCVKQRWLADHTYIDGYRLVFDGTGAQLFGNYLKWFFFTIVTLGIYGFWLGIQMQRWVTRHTHRTNIPLQY
jgi:uncharacterized membrane protein YjgN (DUF898 family)